MFLYPLLPCVTSHQYISILCFVLGKSDPYVEVFQGSQKLYKTAKKSNTLNPEWNEQFSFHMQDQSEKMVFKVWYK